MANKYSQIFTLTDIFNNKKLKDKLPLINYKEKEMPNGKVSATTHGKTVNRLVFDTATSAARRYYKPLETHRSGDRIEIGGTLVTDHNTAYEGILQALRLKTTLLLWTANNADMIRDALKEAEKNKRLFGTDATLYLRVQSMEQIEGMTPKQIEALMQNIMENIFFNDKFAKTQKKYGVTNFQFKGKTYEQVKSAWERRVGVTK